MKTKFSKGYTTSIMCVMIILLCILWIHVLLNRRHKTVVGFFLFNFIKFCKTQHYNITYGIQLHKIGILEKSH